MDIKPYKPPVRELASRIYIELAARAVLGEGGLKKDALGRELAVVSFRLAEAFQAVEDELNSANIPRNTDFQLKGSDIEQWSK